MKPASHFREILLLTTSSFSKRQLSENNAEEKHSKQHTTAEQLEAACWNGLLEEILKGVIPAPLESHKLFLWEVVREKSYLKLCMGERPPAVDHYYTLDPHLLLPEQHLN